MEPDNESELGLFPVPLGIEPGDEPRLDHFVKEPSNVVLGEVVAGETLDLDLDRRPLEDAVIVGVNP
jgi:hypothetical protein